jgi:geranylgeranyl diphosphate synthase type I
LKVFGKAECENMSLKKAIDIISSLQIEDIVRKNAMDYINKAMEAINHYEDSEPKNMLKEISQFIVERSK